MAESNKNQTAAERARIKEALGAQLTDHVCASPNCPSPGERIIQKELYPVVTLRPAARRTLFYHKACGPKSPGVPRLPSRGRRTADANCPGTAPRSPGCTP